MTGRLPRWLGAIVALVYLFLHLPLLVLMVFSFNASRFSVEWTGLTLEWYRQLLERPDILAGLRVSLIVGVISTVVATALGTLLALALARGRFRGRGALESLLYVPLVTPEIVGRAAARVSIYYAAWGVVLLVLWMLSTLIEARVGRALRAIHGSVNAAAAVGIPIAAYKTRTFVLAAALAALGGVLATHYNGGIGPSEASVMKSVRYVAIVAVGGMANLRGAVVMGTILTFLSLRGYFGSLDDLVFGGILLAMMLFAPEGVVGAGLWRGLRGAFTRARRGGHGTAP